MIRTIEAIISEKGEVSLLETVSLKGSHRALVTILNEEPSSATQQGKRMAEALETLAQARVLADVNEPVAWQREQRQDRPLPERDAS